MYAAMKLAGRRKSPFYRFGLLSVALLSCLTSTLQAQLTATDLIGSAVDQVDDRYSDVSDAIVLFQRGNGPASLAMLIEAKRQHSELPPGEVLFAHLCFASGNTKPGHDVLEVAAVKMKDDPEVWNMLADLQLRREHLAEAEILFKKAVSVAEAYSGNPQRKTLQLNSAHAGAAMANERRGLWEDAESHLRALLQNAPENAEVQMRLAVALINTERYDEAAKLFESVRELNKNQLPAEVILGNTFERLGNQDRAKSSMLTALSKFPDDFATQIAVARWALGIGDDDLALRCASQATILDKLSPAPILISAQVDYLRGDFALAEAKFQNVFQTRPGNFDGIHGLALSILAQNEESKYPLAQEYAELIAKTNNDLRTPQGRQAASLLAWALYRNGHAADAERLMNGVLASGSVSADTAYFAAVIYAQQGNTKTAKDAISKALSSTTASPYLGAAQKLNRTLDNPAGISRP